jgi:lipocalin-like protein
MWMKQRAALNVHVLAFVVAALVFGPAFSRDTPSATASSMIDQLAGPWRLVSRVTTAADGSVLVDPGLSAMPMGVLIYDRTGHVAAQLSRPGRTVEALADECRAAEKVKGTNDTAQTILGYDAYFGTFTVDPKAGVITHHLESALFPGDIGKDIKRSFSISGDTLTIKFHTTIADGTSVVRTLEWTRMK